MEYYIERKNLLKDDFEIYFEPLKKYFYGVYKFFEEKGYFKAAMEGIYIEDGWGRREQIMCKLLTPNPQIFFMNHLRSDFIYPISECYSCYSEEQLFTVIEILYDNIGKYNYDKEILEKEEAKKEFAEHINNILRFYNGGYYLEPFSGTIIRENNRALKAMLTEEDLPRYLEPDIIGKMQTAINMYYRFDSNFESKKKAINILADILEPLRKDLKKILNEKYEINKNDHDKIIFEIVNKFNIRHNDEEQFTNFEKEIWYDWMMQYYCSVIITYYKLKSIKLQNDFIEK